MWMGQVPADLPGKIIRSVPLRILVADSHDVIRRTVRTTLDTEPAWTVCAEATTGLETLAKVMELNPDVVVMEVGLPGLSVLDLTSKIRHTAPGAHVVALTMHASPEVARRLYGAGVHACLTKADVGLSLVTAIKALLGLNMTDAVGVPHPHERATDAVIELGGVERDGILTMRERQVMQLLADGRSNREIASALMISAKTVETYRGRIMNKLGLRSMNQLVRYAIRHRIISA